MRYCLPLLILFAVALAGIGCRQLKRQQKPATILEAKTSREAKGNKERTASPAARSNDEPPLLLADEPLLLLDDVPDVVSSAGPMADNSRCHVCHMNYMQEELAVVHARANIGCADCHGDSDAHIADESWSWGENGTAPDIMYRRTEINPFCMSCHPRDEISAEQHEPFFAGTSEEKYCADCHGEHRLANRRCKWK